MAVAADNYVRPKAAIPDTVELRGPADADHYRVAVGRYGDRWYTDPLPGDDIADTSTEVYPSVSTVKKASGSDWSFVALKRVAVAVETAQYARLDQMPADHRYEALKAINKLGLSAASQRGTNVHLHAESRLYGRPSPVTDGMLGAEYRGAVDQFFDMYQPRLVAAEFVVVNRSLNGVGYGGTADAVVEIDGGLWGVDWKSRGADSAHGAYPEEAAQEGAYFAGGDYLIVEGVSGPERRRMPKLDGGLIVSIKPDGCRVYPIDLTAGYEHFMALHAWWVARRDERRPVGRQWTPRKKLSIPYQVPSVACLADGGVTQARNGSPVPAPTPDPLDQLHAVYARDLPDDGDDVAADFDAVRGAYNLLDAAGKQWIAELQSQATAAGVTFHAKDATYRRRWEIIRALTLLAQAGDTADDTLRALLEPVIGACAQYPTVPVGHLVGSLSATEAATFGQLVDGQLAIHIDPQGRPSLRPAA